MAPPGTFPSLGPPPLPEGWKADWSTQHNTWFYIHPATGASQWDFPGASSQPQQPLPSLLGSTETAFPVPTPPLDQLESTGGQGEPATADSDRGLGRGLLGAAGGLLVGALLTHKIEEHKGHGHFGIGGKRPLAAGLLGDFGSKLPFMTSTSPPPQPQALPAQATQQTQHHGMSSYMPFSVGGHTAMTPPKLYIHCAAYADQDVTQAVRAMVTPGQVLTIDTDNTDQIIAHFGDPWPDNRKQFSVLYSYGERPWELAATAEACGMFSLIPHQPLDKGRMEFVQGTNSRIVALVWGAGNGLVNGKGAVEKLREMEITGEFQATNDWMGFDGMCGTAKTSVVYYRTGYGGVTIACAREGGTCRLPWNPLARWT